MTLNKKELHIIFDALENKYGKGYSSEPDVKRLQGKLSIMLEVASELERQVQESLRADEIKDG